MSDKGLNRLKELRLERGLSIRQLSEEIEKKGYPSISPDAISKYERGERVPKYEKLDILAEFFGVKPTELMSKEMVGDARKKDLESQFNYLMEFLKSSFRVALDDEITLKVMDRVMEHSARRLPDSFKLEFANLLAMVVQGTLVASKGTREKVLEQLREMVKTLKQ
ncbi:helix-turn-helix domain-containing protein [Ligilactobacillus saerimneri]|uniref:helix-turn-helix domain-containing protein n=1 Tax=Ligilactobacillus saerimneri TaxID=228229 RepID=UPI001C11608A|nr:helix-turn-helix transcriptional regulator [Ligilactobacillus saerimneri]MBU5308857.1 helix-turn-helix transcriptional regulator [Ligilactobacillus saerimneri]